MGIFVQTNYLSNYLSNYLCSLFVLMRFLRLTFSCSCSARHGCTLLHITTRGYHELILIFERKKLHKGQYFYKSLISNCYTIFVDDIYAGFFIYVCVLFFIHNFFILYFFIWTFFMLQIFYTGFKKKADGTGTGK